MAAPALAKTLRRGFAKSLDRVPALLPSDDTAIRRKLDHCLEPQIAATPAPASPLLRVDK